MRHLVGLVSLVSLGGALSVSLMLAGCDSADGSAEAGGADAADDDGSTTATSDDETGTGADEGGLDAGESGEPEDAVCGDCGPGGLCLTDGEDSYCICADGYEPGAVPTECVSCEALESADIDMDIVDLSGPITVNGEEPPASVFDSGALYLFNPLTRDEVFLGETADGSFEARVLAGRYDLIYRSDGQPKTTVPSNVHAVLERGLEVSSDDALPSIDVMSRAVLATLEVDGAPAPDVEVDDAVLSLTAVEGDDVVVLGRTSGDLTARVVPGRYSAVYSADTIGSKMPADSWKQLSGTHLIEPPGAEETTALIDLSIETELYDPQVTLNEGPFPDVEVDDGVLWLVDGENLVVMGRTSSDREPVRVVAGSTFGLVYASESPGQQAPINRWATISPLVGPNESVNVAAHWVAPQLEVDGNPAPDVEVDDAELWLVDPVTGDEAPLGVTSGSVGANVIAGDYDLQYRAQTVGPLMPANTRATLEPVAVDGDWEQVVVVETAAISGDITVDGEGAPDGEFASGRVLLERGEDTVLLGKTSAGSYSRRVLRGTYDLYYAVELPGEAIPSNEHGPVDLGLSLMADQSMAIDIPRRELAGALTIEQSSVPNSPADRGRLYLRAASVGDGASLGDLGGQSYSIALIPGSYSVYYRSDASSGVTPANTNGRVGCFSVD